MCHPPCRNSCLVGILYLDGIASGKISCFNGLASRSMALDVVAMRDIFKDKSKDIGPSTESKTIYFGEYFDAHHNDWAPCSMALQRSRPSVESEADARVDITACKALGQYYTTLLYRIRRLTQEEEIIPL